MNRVEATEGSPLSQFTGVLDDFLGHGVPIQHWPDLVQGRHSLSRFSRPQSPIPLRGRKRRTTFRVRDNRCRASISLTEQFGRPLGVWFVHNQQLDKGTAIEVDVRAAAPGR